MQIPIPEFALVLVTGKEEWIQVFSQKYFKENQIIDSQDLETQIVNRLEAGKLTVIQALNFEEQMGQSLIKLAKRYHYAPIAIMLGEEPHLSMKQEIDTTTKESTKSIDSLLSMIDKVGFKNLYHLKTLEDIENVQVQCIVLANNKRDEHGPFDVIGDVHGCYDELCDLLSQLGYNINKEGTSACSPVSRKLAFVGDLVDRGPKTPEVLKLVMNMVKNEQAYCVLGNHDGKLLRKLKGANVQVIHGLETTMEQLAQEPIWFIEEVKLFLEGLVSHYVFDNGKLVVAHAGLKEKFHGRESKKIRDLAMFGETTGELDELGLPVRLNWSEGYAGEALVIYGHTPKREAEFAHHTINIDTGCVYGGKLTAYRYPEGKIVTTKARKAYYESARPFL